MTHRIAFVCRFVLLAVALAASPLALASATQPAPDETYETLMYTALCRGILWPDGMPVLIASDTDTLPADVALEIATRDLLARAAESIPVWAHDLSAEALAGSVWRAGVDDTDPVLLGNVAGECRVHLRAEIFGG